MTTTIVRFDVYIPISSRRGEYTADAPWIAQAKAAAQVEAYLYNPLKVLSTTTEQDDRRHVVTVWGCYEVSRSEVDRLVQYQRDRFASGMYRTTEPTFEER